MLLALLVVAGCSADEVTTDESEGAAEQVGEELPRIIGILNYDLDADLRRQTLDATATAAGREVLRSEIERLRGADLREALAEDVDVETQRYARIGSAITPWVRVQGFLDAAAAQDAEVDEIDEARMGRESFGPLSIDTVVAMVGSGVVAGDELPDALRGARSGDAEDLEAEERAELTSEALVVVGDYVAPADLISIYRLGIDDWRATQ